MNKTLLACVLIALAGCAKQDAAPSPGAATTPATDNATAEPAPPQVDVPAGSYTLDKYHATLVLRVDHLGFSKYVARFQTFDAQLQFDPGNYAAASVTVTVDPKSLAAENPPEGFLNELIGKDWLDTAQFPTLTFRSTTVTPTGARTMKIDGDLTLHGVTKPISLDATFNGGYAGHPMDPHARIGFSAHGSFKRSDFGISYGLPPPGTTMGVSDNVDVAIEAEFSGPPFKPTTEASGG